MSERKPLRKREWLDLQDLIGAVEALDAAQGLIDRAPTIRAARDTAAQAFDEACRTIPTDRLVRIKQDLKHTRIYTKVEAPGITTVDTTQYRYVEAWALNRLIARVVDTECLMCDKSAADGKKCPLREVMEAVLPHELEYTAPDGCCKWSGLALGLEGAE